MIDPEVVLENIVVNPNDTTRVILVHQLLSIMRLPLQIEFKYQEK